MRFAVCLTVSLTAVAGTMFVLIPAQASTTYENVFGGVTYTFSDAGKVDASGNVYRSVKFKSNTKAGKRSVKVTAKKSKSKPKYSTGTKVKYYK